MRAEQAKEKTPSKWMSFDIVGAAHSKPDKQVEGNGAKGKISEPPDPRAVS